MTRRGTRGFEWDDHKAASNLRKHGVSFEGAIATFDDEGRNHLARQDNRGEPRFKRTELAVEGDAQRPVKQQITLRLDANVLDRFKRNTAKGYQTDINRVLSEDVASRAKRPADRLRLPRPGALG